ncbi:linker histone H1 and H5 family protein [Loa loa]|uniref:Linker histone H1 and H5 family protein n=1 Tax=Loa loa TaxID=7209 RepID=A0A1I7VUI9_LOALO|nr:linker histone H1 and H5 family protein [Loa loa]EFO21801.2 linker histone H1 and H5 family protein [Loa loa]
MEASAVELPSPPRLSSAARSPKNQSRAQGTPKARSKRQGTKTTKSHPSYSQMVKEAITVLKDRKGSSRVAILKYISTHYQLGGNGKRVHFQLRQAIKKGIASGKFTLAKGAGVNGSFRLGTKVEIAVKKRSDKQKRMKSKQEKESKVASASSKKPQMTKVAAAKKSLKRKLKTDKPKPKVSRPKKTS